MYELVLTPKFRRSYRRFVRRNQRLQNRIDTTLIAMATDVFTPSLGTHKLSGNLFSLWACSCGYDCRIIFSLEKNEEDGSEVIILQDIGRHDEVY